MRFFSKKFLWVLIPVLAVGGLAWFFVVSDGNEVGEAVVIERGDVKKEVFETGTIIKGERSAFGFHVAGRISSISVSVGDEVVTGQVLAVLGDPELAGAISEAREGVNVAQAELNKVLKEVTAEEIEVYETAVDRVEAYIKNLENRLEDANEALTDVEKATEASLNSAIEDSFEKAKIATEIARSAMLEVTNLHFVHFYASTYKNLELLDAKVRAISVLLGGGDTGRWNVENVANLNGGIWGDLREIVEDLKFEEIKELLIRTMEALKRTLEALDAIPLSDVLSSVEKNLIQSYRNSVTQQYSIISATLEGLRVLKIDSENAVSSATREIRSVEDSILLGGKDLKEAEARLAHVKSPLSDVDGQVAQARLRQAQAVVRRLEARSVNNRIVTSINGTVSGVLVRLGEAVSPGVPVVEIIPNQPFQVEMYVYEGDISDMRVGDKVTMEIVAFPGRVLDGKIVVIESAGELINGVVHYRVLINPTKTLPTWTFPNMTVDVNTILTLRKNVILVPDSAVNRSDGEVFVNVLRKDGTIEKRNVVLGIRSLLDRKIEVLDGLSEGEKVILD